MSTFSPSLPLNGQTILVTRTETGKSSLSQLLETQGANTWICSTTSIQAPTSWDAFDEVANSCLKPDSKMDWIVFGSSNGVRWCMKRLGELEIDHTILNEFRIACVGQTTASCVEGFGLKVELVPDFFQSEDLLESLKQLDIKEKNFWLPQAEKSREVLYEGLLAEGAIPHSTPVYQNILPEQDMTRVMQKIQSQSIDWITFTSSSAVKNFFQLLPNEFGEALKKSAPQVACIGKITAATAHQYGLKVHVVPEEQTMKGLVNAIVKYGVSQ